MLNVVMIIILRGTIRIRMSITDVRTVNLKY